MADPDKLTDEQTEKTKKYSIVDGSAYSIMYGFGEQYVTPFAIKLGASNSEIGILASVPSFIGSLFQIIGAELTDKFKNRKKIVTWFILFQAIILLPLFFVPFLTKSMLWLTFIFSLYLIFANIVGPAWNSWIGDVIPDDERAKYFSTRNKLVITSMMFSVLLAGLILNYFSNINIWTGFGILFIIAFIGRLISWYYLTRQFEPKYVVDKESYFSFKDFLKRMPETNFGNFVIFRSLIAFTVMIASPFFAVYMLKDLNIPYWQYTVVLLAPMLVKVMTMTYWSKYSSRFGSRNIMIVSAVLIATIPLWWFLFGIFFEGKEFIFILLIFAESISGFAWAGFELTTFNYVLETVSSEKRARCFAYFNVVFGTAVMLGGLLGSWLVANIGVVIGLKTIFIVFLVSAIARSLVAIIFSHKMKEVVIKRNIDETKLFFDLVLAKPINSALHQTTATLMMADKELTKITDKTQYVLTTITEPIMPHVDTVITHIDKGLEKAEPFRKSLEPKAWRKQKKKDYKHLVDHKYNKKLMRHFIKGKKHGSGKSKK
ncbi:TPA: MFS transporter [Candidatus Woesearchaeota archaeon]|nr:MFS transporter [Candidatus Woesearchaeota archaeon]